MHWWWIADEAIHQFFKAIRTHHILVSFLSVAKPDFFPPKMLCQEPVGGVTGLRDGASIFYIHSFNIEKGFLVLFLCSPVRKVAQ